MILKQLLYRTVFCFQGRWRFWKSGGAHIILDFRRNRFCFFIWQNLGMAHEPCASQIPPFLDFQFIEIFLYSFLVLLRATTLVQKFLMINCCRKISVSIKVSYDLISRLSLVTATTPIQIQPFISTAEKWQEWKSEINLKRF